MKKEKNAQKYRKIFMLFRFHLISRSRGNIDIVKCHNLHKDAHFIEFYRFLPAHFQSAQNTKHKNAISWSPKNYVFNDVIGPIGECYRYCQSRWKHSMILTTIRIIATDPILVKFSAIPSGELYSKWNCYRKNVMNDFMVEWVEINSSFIQNDWSIGPSGIVTVN